MLQRRIFTSYRLALQGKDQSIIKRAITMVLLLCIAMIAIVVWNSWNSYHGELAKTQSSLTNRAHSLAQHAAGTIKAADTILVGLVERLEVDGTGDASLERMHRFLMKRVTELPQLHGIFVYDQTGKWLVNSQAGPVPTNANNSDRDYFKFHQADPQTGPHIGAPVRSKSTNDWIITVTRRFNHADGSFAGVVLTTLGMKFFDDFYKTYAIGKNGQIQLWMDDGTMLAGRPFMEASLGKKTEDLLFLKGYLSAQEGSLTVKSPGDGMERIYSYRRLSQYPLVLSTAVSKEEVLARWRIETYSIFTGIFLLLIALGILSHRLVGQINRRNEAEVLRQAADARIQELAFYDQLTGLPNRSLLIERVQKAMLTSARNKKYCALFFLDLDNFKSLNDLFGHDKGDLLLQQVAVRLVSCVRESDTVARLGGDEFVVMLEDLSGVPTEAYAQAGQLGEKILGAFITPFILNEYEHFTSPSIGVAVFSDASATVEEQLKKADLAMYEAKAAGRNTIRYFDPQMQVIVNNRASLEADLRQALLHDELQLYLQPQLTAGRTIIGAEALLRWHHAKRGMVSPAEFIPVAEHSGLIIQVGNWVLHAACLQLIKWAAIPETASLTIAVNVSARQFRHPDFVVHVLTALEDTGANPLLLKLELTESVLVDDMEATIAKMNALKVHGISFSLDDFGTGYSSLAYLKRMPIDQLKIDQSFVRDMLVSPNDASIVKTILALGRAIGIAVIAEGVETGEQYQLLLREGCVIFQGYYFGRPLPVNELQNLIFKDLAPVSN